MLGTNDDEAKQERDSLLPHLFPLLTALPIFCFFLLFSPRSSFLFLAYTSFGSRFILFGSNRLSRRVLDAPCYEPVGPVSQLNFSSFGTQLVEGSHFTITRLAPHSLTRGVLWGPAVPRHLPAHLNRAHLPRSFPLIPFFLLFHSLEGLFHRSLPLGPTAIDPDLHALAERTRGFRDAKADLPNPEPAVTRFYRSGSPSLSPRLPVSISRTRPALSSSSCFSSGTNNSLPRPRLFFLIFSRCPSCVFSSYTRFASGS